MFGPYGGVNIQDAEKAHASGYCWQVGVIIKNIFLKNIFMWPFKS